MATRRDLNNKSADEAPSDLAVPTFRVVPSTGYILAHQNVTKQTAQDYTTSLTGLKFKIAHKRADSEKCGATPRTQRKRMISFLRSALAELEKQSDREVAAIAASETAAARKRATLSRSVTKRAKGRRRRRTKRVSALSSGRGVTRVRHGRRSKMSTTR